MVPPRGKTTLRKSRPRVVDILGAQGLAGILVQFRFLQLLCQILRCVGVDVLHCLLGYLRFLNPTHLTYTTQSSLLALNDTARIVSTCNYFWFLSVVRMSYSCSPINGKLSAYGLIFATCAVARCAMVMPFALQTCGAFPAEKSL